MGYYNPGEQILGLCLLTRVTIIIVGCKIPYIENFSRREILAKTTLLRCVKFSLSSIFAILRIFNESV